MGLAPSMAAIIAILGVSKR